ncbi:MAG: hypothetical protein RSD82_07965 [Comamonas sp.]
MRQVVKNPRIVHGMAREQVVMLRRGPVTSKNQHLNCKICRSCFSSFEAFQVKCGIGGSVEGVDGDAVVHKPYELDCTKQGWLGSAFFRLPRPASPAFYLDCRPVKVNVSASLRVHRPPALLPAAPVQGCIA